jgi:hypothetical protein
MKDNSNQQLDLFEDKDNTLPADIVQVIADARVAWLKRIHSKRPVRYHIYQGGVK